MKILQLNCLRFMYSSVVANKVLNYILVTCAAVHVFHITLKIVYIGILVKIVEKYTYTSS